MDSRKHDLPGAVRAALNAICDVIGEPPFIHDPTHIEQDFDVAVSRVRVIPHPTILPPDLFHKHEGEAFWGRRSEMPDTIRVV